MRTVKEFAIRRSLNFDTVVIGGGTTGIAAAVASARNGAKTLLVESNGFLGGNGASIPSWMGFHSRSGEAVIGGIALELVQEMQRREGASRIYPDPAVSASFNRLFLKSSRRISFPARESTSCCTHASQESNESTKR